MRWLGGRESDNVEDRRGGGGGGMVVGGGIGTVVIALVIYLLGGDPSQILNSGGDGQAVSQQAPSGPQPDDAAALFSRRVLTYTENIWTEVMAKEGQQYRKPVLVLFRGQTQSGCGMASAASGPFYCPGDKKLYIDLSFYDELKQRFDAPGDFAMAYVIAHEIGHSIQDQWGILSKVHQAQERMSEADANRLSVRLELQADFLAGVWAHYAQQMKVLEPGDVEEALKAASAIGDDNIQKATQGYVTPEGFTHGTAAQRAYWFKKGFETGDINQGDTFNSREDARLQ
ncbi:KPN_02809 family neutral zinc metallopeptidase [Fibrella forsythiae]|uniref:Neutral zinc metallopeptidase n=1 Tax=Fibrella forsythiae TaxID=2817061 RepID=A0ABS3JDZ7_9BACT|nr:neutral zinc metallopeptidase [Fibrella forsythiae]MBO0948222.1 neutral zinc metallopeptidase [Fibrella forsythiae]